MNGRPYFVRGLGDDYVEPITGTLIPDKNVYCERIRLCKQYGFNGFRYLGHTPSREVFDAADEAGFLILAETPAYWNMWPGQDEIIPLYKTGPVVKRSKWRHNHYSTDSSYGDLVGDVGGLGDVRGRVGRRSAEPGRESRL